MTALARAPLGVFANSQFSADNEWLDGALGSVIVDVYPTIFREAHKLRPLLTSVIHGEPKQAFRQNRWRHFIQPFPEFFNDWAASEISRCEPIFGRFLFQLALNGKQPVNPVQHFLCPASRSALLRRQSFQRFIGLPAKMRPAPTQRYIGNIVISGIAVCMQVSLESFQEFPRVFP